MSEQRRLSTRNRGEPPLKKRAMSPPTPSTAPAPLPPPAEPLKEGLPTKLKEGRPLPTLSEPQNQSLPVTSHQTIAESGVLAASLERSRQRWLNDGIFERYWAKPSKKKEMANTPNPAKETMTRLGVCSMSIDPHVFEVTLYTVKDLPLNYPPAPIQPPSLSAPQYNPFSQVRPQGQSMYNVPSPAPPLPYLAPPQAHSTQHSLPTFREGFGSFGPQGPSPIYHPPVQTAPVAHNHPPAIVSRPPDMARTGSASQGAPKSENSETNTDPVIKMLATRAASDTALKTLMKVVASGDASQPQLREFQDHIDELNSILKSQSIQPATSGHDGGTDGSPQPPEPVHPPRKPNPSSGGASTGTPTAFAPQNIPPIKVEFSAQPYLVAATPPVAKASNSNRKDISGIVFDFGGTGDRFSIPRFSILEYLYGGTQVIVSFIIIRRGSTAGSGNYKGTMNYYQPITLRLSTPHPKVLEPLARAVAAPDEVRNYMNNYFDRLSPAEKVHLAMRLPRPTDTEEREKQDSPMVSDLVLTRPVYSPPNSIMPLAA